jgi:integrase
VLREMPKPLHLSADTFVFVNQVGRPLDEERFVEKHWHRALRATGVRPRKFYATRHTFISVALSRGANLKWIADYCGTSVEMIERPYGKFLHDDTGQLALLSGPRESPCSRNRRPYRRPSCRRAKRPCRFKAEGGRFELA